MENVVRIGTPFITDDAVTFGLLMAILAIIFFSTTVPRLQSVFRYIPALLLCYFVPAVFSTTGIVSHCWFDLDGARELLAREQVAVSDGMTVIELKEAIGEANLAKADLAPFIHESQLYFVASRYLLPACLILLTLGVDLREIIALGPKALIMFLAGTVGVILGGPLAIWITSAIAPDLVGGQGPDEVWRGMATVAGSWIGGGANQAAMEVLYKPSGRLYSQAIAVDIIVAETWMCFLLLGIGKAPAIDAWFRADTHSIDVLKQKMESFGKSVAHNPSFVELIVLLGIAFGGTGLAHGFGAELAQWFQDHHPTTSRFSLTHSFFWLIVLSTLIGVVASFTRLRQMEGAGASKIGTVFIYVLVATIGMKMDVMAVFENPGIFAVGYLWMAIHVLLLIIVGRLIRSPFFFLAVGSKANIGGAASAPVVAGAFHPSLAPVGVLLAVLGYALGTYGAWLCAILMRSVSHSG